MYKGDTSTHAEGTDPRGGLSERARVRRHYGPLYYVYYYQYYYYYYGNRSIIIYRLRHAASGAVKH